MSTRIHAIGNWTRNSDGTWSLDGWTIRRQHMSGDGQVKPFTPVSSKAKDVWNVYTPEGFLRTGSTLLANAKASGKRQIAIEAERSPKSASLDNA